MANPAYRLIKRSDFKADGAETWLWCIQCESFFQEKHLGMNGHAVREKCPFCEGFGFGAAIFPWLAFREPHWPTTASELRHGAKAPGRPHCCDRSDGCEHIDDLCPPLVAMELEGPTRGLFAMSGRFF
jgi:hypothetical protein